MKIALVAVTGTIAGVGLAIFLYGAFRAFRGELKPKPGQEMYMGDMRGPRQGIPIFRKSYGGPTGGVRMSLGEVKGLIRSKSWQTDPSDKTFLLMIGGAMITVAGGFLTSAILVPSWKERLYIVGTLVLVGFLISRNFARSEPPPPPPANPSA
jgi:hypothetical protein